MSTQRRIRAALTALAGTIALALALGACASGQDRSDAAATETAVAAEVETTTTTDVTEEAEPEAAEAEPRFELEGELPLTTAEVNDMLTYIEAQAGREYLYPPTIVAQERSDYEVGLEAMFEDQVTDFVDEVENMARFYQALGLTDQTPDELTETIVGLMTSADGINGYYDPEVDALYVPVDALSDGLFRSLLVHELVHALDGQHVDLAQIIDDIAADPDNTELNFGRTAVVEGRATAIQLAWMQANGVVPTPQDLSEDVRAAPPAFLNALTLPYGFGAGWVTANGGAAGTWDAFDNPPTSSEHVLFPDTPTDEAVVEVPIPDAEGPVLDSGPWGAADLLVWLLSETAQPGQAEVMRGLVAADGWAGGSVVLWGDDSESCVRASVAADSDADLAELQAAIGAWVNKGDGRDVERTGDIITVTGCTPFLA